MYEIIINKHSKPGDEGDPIVEQVYRRIKEESEFKLSKFILLVEEMPKKRVKKGKK